MRQALVFRAHGAVQPVNIFDVVSALSSGGEVLIFADSRVQLQPEYRDNQSADRTFFSGCSRFTRAIAFDKVVGLKRLVDIQHGILRLIKPGEQFINDYQQFELLIGIETTDDITGIHRLILRADIILPPFRHFRQFAFIHFGIPFRVSGGLITTADSNNPASSRYFYI